MPTHRYQRITFDAPEHWLDASTIVLVSPDGPPDHRPNVVIGRDEGEDVVRYAKQQLSKLRAQTKAFREIVAEPTEVGGRPGFFAEHSFRTPEKVMVRQQQLYVQDGAFCVILSLTHIEEDFESVREAFTQLRQSFRVG